MQTIQKKRNEIIKRNNQKKQPGETSEMYRALPCGDQQWRKQINVEANFKSIVELNKNGYQMSVQEHKIDQQMQDGERTAMLFYISQLLLSAVLIISSVIPV